MDVVFCLRISNFLEIKCTVWAFESLINYLMLYIIESKTILVISTCNCFDSKPHNPLSRFPQRHCKHALHFNYAYRA